MKKAMIADARFAEEAIKAWGDEFDIIPTAEIKGVDEAIKFHADIQLVNIGGSIICAPSVFGYFKKRLKPYGINVICGAKDPAGNYPKDSAYNIAVTKKVAFFKKGTADSIALEYMGKNNIRTAYVNQGYAKCSSVVASDCIITADPSVFAACKREKTDCLKIKEGEVRLFPYKSGFLGGATGYFQKNVFFFGDITEHSDYLKISDFLKTREIGIKYIKNFPLTDIGTIFFPY